MRSCSCKGNALVRLIAFNESGPLRCAGIPDFSLFPFNLSSLCPIVSELSLPRSYVTPWLPRCCLFGMGDLSSFASTTLSRGFVVEAGKRMTDSATV